MDREFRANHMKVKKFLFTRSDSEQMQELSRAKMFPLYLKELEIRKIDKNLAKRDSLDESTQ